MRTGGAIGCRAIRLVLVLLAAVAGAYGQEEWSAGVAAVDVTPREAIWLSGYANRTRASAGVVHPIFVKAAAFRQGGRTAVLVTSDLQGFDVAMIEEITRRSKEQFGVGREEVVLNYSHNHCGVFEQD
jgi:neutral ceramidase